MDSENSTRDPEDLQKIIFDAVTEGATISAAAAKVGVHRSTVYRWLRCDDIWRGAVREAMDAHSDSVDDQVTEMSRKALSVLHEILEQPDISREMRFRAAVAVLTRTARRAWNRPRLPDAVCPPPEPPPPDPYADVENEPHFRIPRPWAKRG